MPVNPKHFDMYLLNRIRNLLSGKSKRARYRASLKKRKALTNTATTPADTDSRIIT